jgi:hypothetical protein
MQSVAEINEIFCLVDRNRETIAAVKGMADVETQVPGQVVCTEFVAGQPVHSEIKPVSTQHSVAAIDAITIGQVLQVVSNIQIHLSVDLILYWYKYSDIVHGTWRDLKKLQG